MSTLVQDLRFALRGFARTAGIALLAIATLAVGVGANAAIFSVIHRVMIEPLPYPAADRLVIPWRTSASMGNLVVSPAQTDLPAWLASAVFDGVTTYSQRTMVLTGSEEPEQMAAAHVDTPFLDFTGAHPVLGRPFHEGDAASEAAGRVALLTDDLWRRVGGGLGVLLGVWGLQTIAALRPPDMRELEGLRLSWEMLAFGVAVAAVTGATFGVYPALAGSRRDAADALRQGTRAAGDARGRLVRRVLSVAEVALALVLLAGAGLLIRSYARLQSADLGFSPAQLLAVNPGLPASRYPTPAARATFLRQFAERVGSLPDVRYAALASGLPPRGGLMFGELEIEGRSLSAAEMPGGLGGGWISPGYFETLRIPIREGRGFLPDEDRKGAHVVVINDAMAQRYWPGQPAVGKRVRLGAKAPWLTIVGVVGSVKSSHADPGRLQMYYPVTDAELFPDTGLLVATTGDPRAVVAAIKAQAWALDPKLPLKNIATMESRVAETLARPRFNLVLLSIFAGIGLLLAAIGIYGVISYSVGIRTREIGVRMALGATAADIRRAVLGEAIVLAAIGTVLGVAGALALGRFMKALVYEVSASDPVTLLAVSLILSVSALLAAWLPARRAMGVDPMVALRAD